MNEKDNVVVAETICLRHHTWITFHRQDCWHVAHLVQNGNVYFFTDVVARECFHPCLDCKP